MQQATANETLAATIVAAKLPRGVRLDLHGQAYRLRAYAGTNPATRKPQYIYERAPLTTQPREIGELGTALAARAVALKATRRARRKDPHATPETPAAAPRLERTVRHALETWWKAYAQHLASAGEIRRRIDVYLLPLLGDVALWRLRSALDEDEAEADPDLVDLSAFCARLAASGCVGKPGKDGKRTGKGGPMEPSTVRTIFGTLRTALSYAASKGWLPGGNPAFGLRLPGDVVEIELPQPDEMVALLGFIAAPRDKKPGRIDIVATAMLVGSGLRPQEVAALQRGDIDLDTGRMSLTGKGVVKVKNAKPERWEVNHTPTDKRRKRVIHLDPATLDVVRRHCLRRDELALRAGQSISRRAYVFSDVVDCSTHMTPHSMNAMFVDHLDDAREAGLPVPASMKLYTQRHFGITHALRAGLAREEIARRFATSKRMIDDRYGHEIPGEDEAAAAAMGQVWGAVTATGEGAKVVSIRG